MIVLIVTATLTPGAVYAAVALEPHMESWFTRRRLERAHKASDGTSNTDNLKPEPQATSPNVEAETEPHQPRVKAGKSPVHGRKL